MTKVYISGAITGVEDYKNNFSEASDKLRRYGYEVVNPCEICSQINSDCYIDYIIADLIAMKSCTHIYFLENAEQSDGATIERIIAKNIGLKTVEL